MLSGTGVPEKAVVCEGRGPRLGSRTTDGLFGWSGAHDQRPREALRWEDGPMSLL